MEKNFLKWHEEKMKLNAEGKDIYFKEREIWWCSLGCNIGFEQDGKNSKFERPVLVLKKFNKDVLWALPITSRDLSNKSRKIVENYYYEFNYKNKKYAIILSQLRLISSKRLLRKMRTFPENGFKEIKKKLKSLI